MTVVAVLAWLALLGSGAWMIASPGFEPALAVVASLSGVVAVFSRRKSRTAPRQSQVVTGSSVGIQAGGDVSIRTDGARPNGK